MDDDQLRDDLTQLGLNGRNYRALAILPLVMVAWADGRMQSAEAAAIEQAAAGLGLVTAEKGRLLLQRWLSQPPTDAEKNLGLAVLIELARRQSGVGASLSADSLQELITLCESVATAAGSMLGLRDPVSESERTAIAEIARHLSIDSGQSWTELIHDLQ